MASVCVQAVLLLQAAQRLFNVSLAYGSACPAQGERIELQLMADGAPYSLLTLYELDLNLGESTKTALMGIAYDDYGNLVGAEFTLTVSSWLAGAADLTTPPQVVNSTGVVLVDDDTFDPGAYYTTYFPDMLAYCEVRQSGLSRVPRAPLARGYRHSRLFPFGTGLYGRRRDLPHGQLWPDPGQRRRRRPRH
jgi:hypothetical protein